MGFVFHQSPGKSNMKGTVVKFDPARGYGFIRSSDLEKDLFVHIGDVSTRTALAVGQSVTFDVEMTNKGARAVRVKPGGYSWSPRAIFLSIAAGIGLILALIAGWLTQIHWFVAYLLGVNASTLFLYGYDKLIAGSTALRVPEKVLLTVAALGGSPAAVAGQILFHHKTSARKRDFRVKLALIILIQLVVAVVYMLNPPT
jgi:uncharacterized membrane protein YsdA (DUF1294 family)/cold shock CspA family protein